MVWLSREKYNSLCRAANERLKSSGRDEFSIRYNETGMLLWRLSGNKKMGEGEMMPVPFEYIQAVDVDSKFIVFIVYNGKGIMLEDDHDLFPSDGLLAQLKMILK